jgi:hypothetical protein
MKITSSEDCEVEFYQFNSVRRQFHGGRRALTVLYLCNCFQYRAWHVIQSMEIAREWTTACHCCTTRSAVFSVRRNKNWPITLAPLHQRDANRPNVVTVEELNGARQITRPNTEHKYTGASASGSVYQTNAESSASFTQSGRHPPIIIIILLLKIEQVLCFYKTEFLLI